MARDSGRYYKIISLLVKLAIVGLAFGFIYKQVFYRPDKEQLFRVLNNIFLDPPIPLLLLSFALMLLNWGLEAWKWKMLVCRSEHISLWHSFKAVLSGVTIGAFTPNRFGEFAGRIFYLGKTERIDGILMTFAGSTAQLLVTVLMGCSGLIVLAFTENPFPGQKVLVNVVMITVIVLTLLLLIAYFNISLLAQRFSRWKIFSKHSSHILLLARYSRAELLKVFLLSLARYFVFSFQFYLLLLVFGVNIGPGDAFIAISLSYLFVTVIPSFAFAELGIRGVAALSFVGYYSDNDLGIIAASFSLWIINIALPALAGGIFVFGLKFYREKS